MRARWLGAIVLCGLVAAAAAQDPRQGRGRRGGRGADQERAYERIKTALEMNKEQLARFEELVAEQRERSREARQRFQDMRDAMQEGDEGLAEKLRAEMREGGRDRGGIGRLLDELEPILDEDQLEKLGALREQLQSRQRRGGDAGQVFRMMRELPGELDMDESQHEKFRELLAEQRERFAGRRGDRRGNRGGDAEEGQGRGRAGRRDQSGARDELIARIAEILNDEQKKQFEEYVERLQANRGRGGERGRDDRSRGGDVQSLLRAAMRVDLSDEQKEEFQEIRRSATEATRELGRRDTDDRALLAAKVKKQILELLDGDQKEAFERNLARGSRSRGPRREGDRDRNPRRRRDDPSERP